MKAAVNLASGHRVATTTAAYQARLARDAADLIRALKLRYQVFNVELGEGLSTSLGSGYDIDRFDPVVDHIVAEHIPTGDIVGTYRLQTGASALAHEGFYSAQEFDFAPYDSIRPEIVELGRACVHKDHRTSNVLGMLWKRIVEYAIERGCRYLIGCSSLTSQDPAVGWGAYQAMQAQLVAPEFRTVPLAPCIMPPAASPATEVHVPRLLRAYLTIGAQICGPPAIDREFKTIDFLTLIDLNRLSRSVRAHLLR